MPRLFTGLEIPAEIGAVLAQHRGGLQGARWIEPGDYHITLRFIGDVDGATARDITLGLADGEAPAAPTVTLEGLDSFGGARPRAVIARVAPSADLIHLQAEQEAMMERLDLPPERRKYTPHVTLARLRRSTPGEVAAYLAEQGLFASYSFKPERFVLYSARESTGGGPYVVEAAYPFA
jgi:2'-5' RNA ligase